LIGLLAEKGVYRGAEPSKDDADNPGPVKKKDGKPSLKEKIKAKLHKS
jgi:hypothetical protein